jgi:NAD-dependent deacetylase
MAAPTDIPADLITRIARAQHITVLTGAGMSAESGIPTFRGTHDSLWSRLDPMALATEDAWRADAALVWGWYRWRMALVSQAQPNAGHRALAQLARTHQVELVTQNVDDLHERAGSQVLSHVHGSLFALRCFDCGHPHASPLLPLSAEAVPQRLAPPVCEACGGQIRPGVVWFGEALPEAAWQRAQQAAPCDIMLVVGTSGLVHPAASLPTLAQRQGAYVVELNPARSAVSGIANHHIVDSAARALPALVAALALQCGNRPAI